MIAWLLVLSASTAPVASPPAALQVRVTGLLSEVAPVRAALFDSKEGWKGEAAARLTAVLAPEGGGCLWSIPELESGDHAVRVYQDLNGNGELDRDERGRPQEPYGFSGGRKGLFGPPSWRKARVSVDGGPLSLEIRLRSRGGPADEE